MKSVTYHPRLQQSEYLYSLSQYATDFLEAIVRRSSDDVTAEWNRLLDDGGETLVVLTLREADDETSVWLTERDLRDVLELRGRLLEAWNDLLQLRSDRMFEQQGSRSHVVDEVSHASADAE